MTATFVTFACIGVLATVAVLIGWVRLRAAHDISAARDAVGIAVAWFGLRVIATKRTHDRIERAIRTGDPEERIPVDKVVRPRPVVPS